MHRSCRNTTDDEEECKRQGTTTPSAREAWKRRRKKTELLKLQRPDIRARGRTSGACATSEELHQQDGRSISGRTSGLCARTSGASATPEHPALSLEIRRPYPESTEADLTSPDIRPMPRTSGLPRTPAHLAPSPASGACLRAELVQRPMYPLLTYPFVD